MVRLNKVRFQGRILYLTEDPALIQRQLSGEAIAYDPYVQLLDQISTDEITPGWVCFHYDETLGRFTLVGLRSGVIREGDVKNGRFEVIVSGHSKGCGSSREAAPYSEYAAGARLIVAKSIEKIYRQNCENIGLLTSTDFSLLPRIERGEEVSLEEFTRGLDSISADIVRARGLFQYNRERLRGRMNVPAVDASPRPMTLIEKIIASHAVRDATLGAVGVAAVKPGDSVFIRTDIRFSHEYVTPMAEALFCDGFGTDANILEPSTVFTFRDHLSYLSEVMPEDKRKMGLLERANDLASAQERFASKHRIALYGEANGGGSEAICHNAVMEDIALPGMVVVGTDSHTCMAGVLGCFAFGVGSTDIANAWYTNDVRVRVPETLRVNLHGELRKGVAAKDVVLCLLMNPFFREGRSIGKVIEFCGEGVARLALDERATLTNMAVEAGGMTGVIEADDAVLQYLKQQRRLSMGDLEARVVRSDANAEYAECIDVFLDDVSAMLARPGNPKNGVPVSEFSENVRIDIAYGGSCTGGKKGDMDMYASVFRSALKRGKRVADHVACYVQFGSQEIRRYAEEKGYVEAFELAGVKLLQPSCGACINAGPGASQHADQITISAQNRNFPGRSGPGQVYLASPFTVAASAIEGRIVSPESYLE